MQRDLDKILVSRHQIATRVREMGEAIARDLEAAGVSEDTVGGPDVVIIPIMTGAMVFGADLIRALPMKLALRLVAVSSYPGKSMESKGVKLAGEIPPDLAGKHVLVIDDILDSGQTLSVVKELVLKQEPASARIAVLLRKPETSRRGDGRSLRADYVGFDIPDEFVVGYGLDFDGYYRNLPEIAVLRAELTR